MALPGPVTGYNHLGVLVVGMGMESLPSFLPEYARHGVHLEVPLAEVSLGAGDGNTTCQLLKPVLQVLHRYNTGLMVLLKMSAVKWKGEDDEVRCETNVLRAFATWGPVDSPV